MGNDKDSKRFLKPHSEAKIRLLREYLKRYLNIIANDGYTERIKIYDLFCGEGLYENNKEGSPLIILRAIKDLYFSNVARVKKTPFIDCQFNDIDSSKIEKVKKIIKEKSLYYAKFGEINFTSDDYKEEIRNILKDFQSIKKQKGFIFIDPYGYANIKASDIKALINTKDLEVLLFLPTQFMYRFDSKGTPEALIDFIEELSVDYQKWNNPNSSWKYIKQLTEAFKVYLGLDYFVDSFTIEKDPQTIFCLFFFSSHIKGFEKMLEAKWEIDTEQGKGWSYSDNTGNLFSDFKTNPLEEKLVEYLKDVARSNAEIYKYTLYCGFLPKHTNEVFYNLQNSGKLSIISLKNEKIRKGAFYISYKYYKEESNKVHFKLI